MHEPCTRQLERSPTFPTLAPHATRLAAVPDPRSARRQQMGRRPVDKTCSRGRTRGPPLGHPGGCRPHRSLACPRSCTRAPKPMASGGSSGRADGLLLLFTWSLASGIIPAMSAACSKRCGRAGKSPHGGPVSATRRPLPAGEKRPDLPSKGAHAQGQSLVFIDESGFYPLPSVVSTYAPVGHTPIFKEWWTRDHLSAIGAISPEGKLYVPYVST